MAQQIISTNTFTTAKWIVSATSSDGTHTTIASALTSSSSGDTIFIRPGTYTENPTLKAGVNLTAFGSDSSQNGTGKVIINGTCTLTSAGSVTISGIQLQTNSLDLLDVTGSAASIVNLENCYLNCSNNTGITFSSSSSSAQINIRNCSGDLGTTGIKLFAHSSAGALNVFDSDFTNSGASLTASTQSAGTMEWRRSQIQSAITSSSTASTTGNFSAFNCNAINTTALTLGGSGGTTFVECQMYGGTASAISISNTSGIYLCNISSSNTNAITGAGTIQYTGLVFTSTSKTINTTTQTISGTLFGSTTTAPTAGMIGEQIRATVASGSAVNLPNNTSTNITSISLTAGVWDVSGITEAVFTGTSGFLIGSVNGTSATLGTRGDNATALALVVTTPTLYIGIPSYRVTISSSATYYLVAQANFSTGACSGYGRISATRVG